MNCHGRTGGGRRHLRRRSQQRENKGAPGGPSWRRVITLECLAGHRMARMTCDCFQALIGMIVRAPSKQEWLNEASVASRAACLGAWAQAVRNVPRTDLPIFREGVRQTRRAARASRRG